MRILLALVLLLSTLPIAGLVEPERAELLRAKELRDPRLRIGNVYQPAGEALVENGTLAARSAVLTASLGALGIGPERAFLDRRTGRWGTLFLAHPLLPGSGRNELRRQDPAAGDPASGDPASVVPIRRRAWDAFTAYLEARRDALGIDVGELSRPGHVTVHEDGALVQIHAARRIDGVPVLRSYVTAVIRHGNLVLLGTRDWGDRRTPSQPSVSLAAAASTLREHLAPLVLDEGFRKPRLVYVPLALGADPRRLVPGTGLELRLVWMLRPGGDGELSFWEALVDATTGELLAFEDTRHYAATARQVTGGVYPVSNDGAGDDGTEQAGWPMPYAELDVGGEKLYTDGGGNLLVCADATVTTELNGTYLRMNDLCGALSESTAGATLDLGTSGGIDCEVPVGASAGNTHASRSGYFELNRIRAQAASHLPANAWLQGPLTANMNIESTCNANWSGTVNFYRSGGGCTNTGEIAGVFDHEWGHGMDANDAAPGVSNPGEGIADVYASLRLNTSCIGRNFRLGSNCGGYGDPCTTCDGVRDIDWANRSSGLPHDLAWIDANCGGGSAPCGGSVHCEGAVYAEAVWDLWHWDLLAPPFSLDLATAREVATRLTYTGAGLVGDWYSCVDGVGGDGCNADGGYLNYLAADDDDGDLTNGTPHMAAIFNTFHRHGIACPTPTVQNTPCGGTLTAPAVVVTSLDRGALLTWDPVAGADWYSVYRTDGVHGCDFGKELVATTSELEVVDEALQNGREYSYVVIPGEGSAANTCLGPASSCLSITPTAGGHPEIDASSAALSFASGDGDAFLDNCETATLTFDVTNLGTLLTNPTLTSVESTSHPAINASISLVPSLGASLAECDNRQGSFSFTAAGLAFGDTLEFRIGLSGDELGGLSRFTTLRIGDVESDLQAFATKTFYFEAGLEGWETLQGTFDRTLGTGASGSSYFLASSDSLDNQCDKIRSPVMVLQASSTLSLASNYEIEPLSSGTWYDRANVGIVDGTGVRTAIFPDGGRLYNADSSGPGNYSGCNEPEEGWAETEATWGESTWSAAALGSPSLAGQGVRLEVVYSTDPELAERGFYFDEVTVTDFSFQVPDVGAGDCVFIFRDGFESGDTTAWSVP